MKLAKLTGLLRIHFAQEDKSLYPFMMTSTHAQAASLAAAFQREMGDLAPIYEAFATRWSASNAIVTQPADFRQECATVFAALGERIRRENEELYVLADSITSDMISSAA